MTSTKSARGVPRVLGEHATRRAPESQRPARDERAFHPCAAEREDRLERAPPRSLERALDGPMHAFAPSTPSRRVALDSPESEARLARATAKRAFFHLAQQHEAQSNTAFCGVTLAVIVLNALRAYDTRIEKPVIRFRHDEKVEAYLEPGDTLFIERYSQYDLFDDRDVGAVKTYDETRGVPRSRRAESEPGLSLSELDAILRKQGLRTTQRTASAQSSDAELLRELIDALVTEERYVNMNYDRSVIGQHGGRHFSPLGAYDPGSGSFLIMDVNAAFRDWVWAPADRVIAALRPWRGFILIEEGFKPHSITPRREEHAPAPSAPPLEALAPSRDVRVFDAAAPRFGRAGLIDVARARHRTLRPSAACFDPSSSSRPDPKSDLASSSSSRRSHSSAAALMSRPSAPAARRHAPRARPPRRSSRSVPFDPMA